MRCANVAPHIITGLIVVLLYGADGAAAGKRQQLRQELATELEAYTGLMSSVGQERSFCEAELQTAEQRFVALQAELDGSGKRVEEDSISRVRDQRTELEALLQTCRGRAREAAGNAVDVLRGEMERARLLAADVASGGGTIDALIEECESDLDSRFPSSIEQGRYQDVLRSCEEWPRRLERGADGSTCEDDLGRAEYRLGMGDQAAGVALLCSVSKRICLDPDLAPGAMSRLEELESVARRQLGEGPVSDEEPWNQTTDPVSGLSGGADLAASLAACEPSRFAAVRELAQREQAERRLSAASTDGVSEAEGEGPAAEAGIEGGQVGEGHGQSGQEAPVVVAERAGPRQVGSSPATGQTGISPTRAGDRRGGFLSLDIWQSAWGDFSEIEQLVAYVRRNHITEICLNPGQAMTSDLHAPGYRQLKPIVDALRSGGVEVVRYLYAELNYDVVEYARFLKSYPDLGIDFLVDDSEFTDRFIDDFDKNRRAVQAEGIGYGGFVTVERRGNSGVSDSTRRWAIEHLDETILMSYLSCNLADQRQILEPYMSYADSLGRREAVKIAILLGGKKVGRERSCESELSETQLQAFLRDLHGWARSHPSYGGLVLESNYRLPRGDVSPAPLE